MISPSLKILVLSDTHFQDGASPPELIGARHLGLGPLLLRKALLRLRHKGVSVDLVILPGDLLNDGTLPDAEAALAKFVVELKKAKIPYLAVPGNHDFDQALFANVFSCPAGFHEIGGYGFLLFHDTVAAGDVTTRPDNQLTLPEQIARKRPDLPLIAIQHNPIFPAVDSTAYPYMPTNTEAIKESYQKAGVVLSISGHYHPGQHLQHDNEVAFYTAPSACNKPFNFALISLEGRKATVEELSLEIQGEHLIDCHSHTEFAYCGEDVIAESNIVLNQTMGLSGLCLTEHAFHLYFDRETALSYRWQHDRDLVQRTLSGQNPRMEQYRLLAARLKSANVYVGLEVDLAVGGELLLATTDRDGWDILVGAVHALTSSPPNTDAEAASAFMKDVEQLVQQPIHVLAHPFRWFRRAKRERPVHLYQDVAQLLASSGVAAEINFHTNDPDPRFLEACLNRGVKLALGTDSHNCAEVGEFYPHLALLKKLGVTDLAHHCFVPSRGPTTQPANTEP